MSKKTVVLGMSGGVDSSVSAYLLQKMGYDVIGLFMKNWDDTHAASSENALCHPLDKENLPPSVCHAEQDFLDVQKVCEKLSIPYYTINFTKEYYDLVFAHFLEGYQKGITPNPDILCNKEIKFKLFFEKAMALGADYLATGHYAKTENGKLFKADDANKDQSYFLYTLQKSILQKVLFPVGNLQKIEIKKIAKELGLSCAEKKESMGICFIGKKDFRPFLNRFLQAKEGPIMDLEGHARGKHMGCSFYTLGQRKGLCIGGEGKAWFVVKKDMQKNILYVAQGEFHPALYTDELVASDLSFVDTEISSFPFSCHCKIRYRQKDQACILFQEEAGKMRVIFEEPQRAATQGQGIVFYQGTECLGGGIIEKIGPSYYERAKPLPMHVLSKKTY